MSIRVNSWVVACVLGIAALLMVLFSLAIDTSIFSLDQRGAPQGVWIARLNRWFNVDHEANVPTYFSMLLLLSAAVLLGLIGWVNWQVGNPFAVHWIVLSLIFQCLGFDEIVEMHELLTSHVRPKLGPTDYLYYAWVLPGMAFTSIVGLSFLRFLVNLPHRFCVLFVVSSGIYLAGVLGLELVEGHLVTQHGMEHPIPLHFITYSAQEFLEMEGIVLFIYALLEYLCWSEVTFHIEFEGGVSHNSKRR